MYKFLLSSRWLGWFALVCALAAVCAFLGTWQLDRRNAVREDIGWVETNYSADPVPFEEAAGYFEEFDPSAEWLPVQLTGTYDTANQRIVRNRPLNGRPGYEVLVPLKLQDGTAVVINRGWLAIGNNEAGWPDEVPAAPEGEVSVVARIKPAEPTLLRGAPEGQLASIDLATYQDQTGYPLEQAAYGLMSSEDPAPADRPEAAPKPALDEGPHLSYALQWYAFGLLFFVGFGYAARQEAWNIIEAGEEDADDFDDEDEVHSAAPAPRRTRPVRRRRGTTGEEEEDAILDAQGY
ncbi:SURF1 family cytochrome oxidase biogenesis protein [Arthrobacter koreensis]|jgi:cytochrome oxidase assembly protein ShyY1|uniref:SURF1-like protein n=1 Tax=Arthrobacter koreensis TaxID=199136 RepID=A0ABY6FN61_9MICC|nr:SURF1 family protein [Arthrobacter koreensis]MDF2496608.1 cytochrome oxidase biosis protein Surf1, facilitates heme insertion [Arthrobacter koreensis]MEB7448094.1 SURF1 family protein [Arthrobacter koreensis]UYB34636.1 SURF1 family protein [Arthrobacter koreensis]